MGKKQSDLCFHKPSPPTPRGPTIRGGLDWRKGWDLRIVIWGIRGPRLSGNFFGRMRLACGPAGPIEPYWWIQYQYPLQ